MIFRAVNLIPKHQNAQINRKILEMALKSQLLIHIANKGIANELHFTLPQNF